MGKRQKQRPDNPLTSPVRAVPGAAPAHLAAHPPAQSPTLLTVSILLFALWFIFLLVTALSG